MNMPFTIRCPAKINLFLDVGEKRADGFHFVTTLIQSIDLYDEVCVEENAAQGISMECDLSGLPADSSNLCWKAAELVRSVAGFDRGVHISLRKAIPVAAGLGGGSSDAAGVLIALNNVWELGLPVERLREIAARLGSDVPFFVEAGTALCEGRGERIAIIRDAPSYAYVLLTPLISVSTQTVYDSLGPRGGDPPVGGGDFIKILGSSDPRPVAASLYNRLEKGGGSHMGEVGRLKDLLLSRGALGALMSGSGPSVFGIAENAAEAERIRKEITGGGGEGVFIHSGVTNVRHG